MVSKYFVNFNWFEYIILINGWCNNINIFFYGLSVLKNIRYFKFLSKMRLSNFYYFNDMINICVKCYYYK